MTEKDKKESIGEQFRKARARKKLTIDQVYKDTKIHPKILTALEEDKYEEFLNPIYIKAFIKSYCRYLQLDANKIFEEYDNLGLNKKSAESTLVVKEDGKQPLLSKFDWHGCFKLIKKWIVPAGTAVLILLLSIFMIVLAYKAAMKIRGFKFSKAKKPAVAVSASNVKGPSMLKPLSIPHNQPLALIVKTRGDAWLKVVADGETIFESVLKKGSVETYNAKEGFQLHTGKGEYLDLVLNGNPLGSPGAGVIKNISLTHKGLEIEKK